MPLPAKERALTSLTAYIDGAPLTSGRLDFMPDMKRNLERRRNISIMRASGMTEGYDLRCSAGLRGNTFDDPKLPDPELYSGSYSAKVTWNKYGRQLIKHLPREQLLLRSRGISFSMWPCIVNEMKRRVNNKAARADDLKRLTLDKRKSAELALVILQATLRNMSFDYDNFVAFAKDHKTSSLGLGWKWADLLELPRSDIRLIYEAVRSVIERMVIDTSKSLGRALHMGSRARIEGLEYNEIVTGILNHMVYRTRLVTFDPAMSTWTAFIPNKRKWYNEILTKGCNILGVSVEWYSPLVEGGHVYQIADVLFKDGYNFEAWDGANWESVVPMLGEGCNVFWTYFGGTNHLPSGISLTSALGTLAALYVFQKFMARYYDGKVIIIVLGDDVNVFFHRKRGEVPAWLPIEMQPDDTRLKYVLGGSFAWGGFRTCGLKATVENPDAQMPIKLINGSGSKDWVRQTSSPVEQIMQFGTYFSRFGHADYITVVGKVEPENWRGPSEMQRRLIKEYAASAVNLDVRELEREIHAFAAA